jgi:hypothetical protein
MTILPFDHCTNQFYYLILGDNFTKYENVPHRSSLAEIWNTKCLPRSYFQLILPHLSVDHHPPPHYKICHTVFILGANVAEIEDMTYTYNESLIWNPKFKMAGQEAVIIWEHLYLLQILQTWTCLFEAWLSVIRWIENIINERSFLKKPQQ